MREISKQPDAASVSVFLIALTDICGIPSDFSGMISIPIRTPECTSAGKYS